MGAGSVLFPLRTTIAMPYLALALALILLLAGGCAPDASRPPAIAADGVAPAAAGSHRAPRPHRADRAHLAGQDLVLTPYQVTALARRHARGSDQTTTAQVRGDIERYRQRYRRLPPDSPDRPLVLRRLALALAELSYRLDLDLSQGQQQQTPQERGESLRRWRATLLEATELLDLLRRRHRLWCLFPAEQLVADQGCNDEAMYQLGVTQELSGELGQAEEAYRFVLRSWPSSPFAPHARFSLAALALDQAAADAAKRAAARASFEQIAAGGRGQSPFWLFAHYQLANLHLAAGDQTRAIEQLSRVAKPGGNGPASPEEAALAHAAAEQIAQLEAAP